MQKLRGHDDHDDCPPRPLKIGAPLWPIVAATQGTHLGLGAGGAISKNEPLTFRHKEC